MKKKRTSRFKVLLSVQFTQLKVNHKRYDAKENESKEAVLS